MRQNYLLIYDYVYTQSMKTIFGLGGGGGVPILMSFRYSFPFAESSH